MTSQEFKEKAITLIDDLNVVCANYGFGNDGDLGIHSIDTQYPVFVLAFCVYHKRHYSRKVVPALEV